MGIKFYSFSISWTRILPFALPGSPVNSNGLEHYDNLTNYAITKGVQPVVALLHMDTPLQFFGDYYVEGIRQRPYYGYFNMGYQNETFEEAFVNYGKIIMSRIADRVPIWVTVNKPQTGCVSGPSIDHIIKAHARLYNFYHDELHGTGKITMKMAWTPGVPEDPKNETHLVAVQHYNDLLAETLKLLVLGQDYHDAFKNAIQDYVALSAGDLAPLRTA
ncbi:Glycoside hydrolase family 1 [Macrophomina phaseolina MS6]|uniref:Glycoside hydrolase family 1 n=1 Tax=Macrophomina phaseolina (strain MS6) TaxID=1126212 RepID=K2S3K3_MACPH|nr:Glycoside hydrolase family 1 [Macrophomina phaseolina MS6]